MMKQDNSEMIAEGLELLAELKQKRGGKLLDFHKRCANDTKLLKAFTAQYDTCNAEENTVLERKHRELILMALGCAEGVSTTIITHAELALQYGATVEEVGEVLRLIFFYCGASKLIPSVELFELLEGSEAL